MTYATPHYQNPVILRASAVLPAAGAWDPTPVEIEVPTTGELVLSLSYTRGAGGGAFDWQVEYSIYSDPTTVPVGALEWVPQTEFDPTAVAAGVDTQIRGQRSYQTYQATGAAQEGLSHFINWKGAIERVRVRARESGVVGSPGTLQISGVLR